MPAKMSQRHLSISRPKGRKATFSSASFICTLMRPLVSLGTAVSSPRSRRYRGVMESASASPNAS